VPTSRCQHISLRQTVGWPIAVRDHRPSQWLNGDNQTRKQ